MTSISENALDETYASYNIYIYDGKDKMLPDANVQGTVILEIMLSDRILSGKDGCSIQDRMQS